MVMDRKTLRRAADDQASISFGLIKIAQTFLDSVGRLIRRLGKLDRRFVQGCGQYVAGHHGMRSTCKRDSDFELPRFCATHGFVSTIDIAIKRNEQL
jgi:hypothetical protein